MYFINKVPVLLVCQKYMYASNLRGFKLHISYLNIPFFLEVNNFSDLIVQKKSLSFNDK